MNTSTKNNLLIGSVIVLIIANVAILTTIWYMHHRDVVHRGTPADYLVKELGLNEEQKNKLHELASEHHHQAQQINEQIKNARDSFFSLLKQPNVTDSTKKTAADNIAKHLEQLELLTFDHFQQARNICTSEQQKKFDEILQDVLRMIGGPPQGQRPEGPPPHDGNGPPPPDR